MQKIWALVAAALLGGCSEESGCPGDSCPIGGGASPAEPAAGHGVGGAAEGGGAAAGGGGAAGLGGEGVGGSSPVVSTITVVDLSGDPGIGLDVITNEADGTLAASAVTGPQGSVELTIPVGGTVSLLYTVTYDGDSSERHIETVHFADAAPPVVRLNAYFPELDQDATATMTQNVIWPPKAGTPTYDVRASCYSVAPTSQQSVSKPNAPGCTSDGLYDLLVVARNAAGTVIDHGRVDDAVFMANGAATHSISWTGIGTVMVELQAINLPTGAEAAWLSTASFQSHPGGYAVGYENGEFFQSPGNEISGTLQQLSAYGSRHCQSIGINVQDSLTGYKSLYRQRCAPTADLSPLVFDAARLSRYEPSETSVMPLALQWDQAWDGDEGDVVVATETWLHESLLTTWSNYVEPGAGKAVFVELPGYLTEYGFDDGDELDASRVVHHDYVGLEGFSAMVSTTGLPNIFEATTSDAEGYASTRYP